MTKEEYMEEHHHITESGIGLIATLMAVKRYDDVWVQIRNVQDELSVLFEKRMNTIKQENIHD